MTNDQSNTPVGGTVSTHMRSLGSLAFDLTLLLAVATVLALVVNKISPAGIAWARPLPIENDVKVSAQNLGFASLDLRRAQQIVEDGEYLIFDARAKTSYAKGHIPGAMSLPSRDAQKRITDFLPLLLPDQPVMVYCSGQACSDSIDVAEILKQQGIEEIAIFVGGYAEWQAAGLEEEIGE